MGSVDLVVITTLGSTNAGLDPDFVVVVLVVLSFDLDDLLEDKRPGGTRGSGEVCEDFFDGSDVT